ncbi:5-oxoprolinase subunit B family protein [Nocardioides nitrophenolicus]|uniref:5-oxoprolinase subunit B family protein n=1 Tax=Nocardioides nitrophenolicus TaxID=60489 RepID=UPI00195DEB7D|nr:allophanate hydrolase subunit 1 [Nocardioides nitrophenolicus]MBM7516946.1 KipI family sensor histidine kinase inhibitor [Nocardioides nitrophenolicus]
MRVLPYGDRAFLLEFDDVHQVIAHHAAIVAAAPPGIVELVPAARTILVEVDVSLRTLDDVVREVTALDPLPPDADRVTPLVEVPIKYDGPDLADAASAVGLSVESFVRRHADQAWVAAFTGFAPGFAYLVGEDEWEIPRRASPRVAVPTGAVAMAGPFTGIYPRESPGGWQIIGHTDVVLWDLDRESPALIPAGHRVRFRERT